VKTSAGKPWWSKARHDARRPVLRQRMLIQEALSGWFERQKFQQVDTSELRSSPGNETHLHAFATDWLRTDGSMVDRLYLHTSPEFSLKKLLAAGETRLFEFARVFRNRERGPLHAPEFTMLEWYRALRPYSALMDDAAELIALAAEVAGTGRLTHHDRSVDPYLAPERLTLAEAFDRFAGIDLLATISADGLSTDTAALMAAARSKGIRVADDDSWSDVFTRVLLEKVEPQIGRERITILTEYPAPEAALARRKPDNPRVAERFEIFACGVELANAFGELTDVAEQRRRFEADMAAKERIYGETYPLDEVLLSALAEMSEASGAALGFDRLVMLAAGVDDIDDVLWTPAPLQPDPQS
jgi:elongation factor P--(R)-beta-lysine ligase